MDLFAEQRRQSVERVAPLAVRMRPCTLDEFAGQQHFLGTGKPLRRLIEADRLTTAIFYGPPGSGKTSLAELIARLSSAEFETLHAAEAGVKDVRAVIERAIARLESHGRRTLLFLDEIHRFTRAQQDSLLKDVERGVLVLIGATTENPFFSVNGPLISRGQVFRFEPLTPDDLLSLLRRAAVDSERGLGALGVDVDDDALQLIAGRADGDARRALAALEVAALSELAALSRGAGVPADADHAASSPTRVRVTAEVAAESMQTKAIAYDAAGDMHYDVTSAFIKSMRGSDPDATVYWLARMLEGGEDPRFIARRIAIHASEDVGNADPRALMIASAAIQVCEAVGLPECQLALAQAAIYVACAPKSNAVYEAINAARVDVREKPLLAVPPHVRDTAYQGAAKLGHGRDYLYPHDYAGAFVVQDYLGAVRRYYEPSDRGEEKNIGARLKLWRDARAVATTRGSPAGRNDATGDATSARKPPTDDERKPK